MGSEGMQGETTATTTEAVAVFDTAEGLESAVDELMSHGFDRAEISLLASEAAVEEKLDHLYRRVEALEDDERVPRTAYVSTEALGDAEGGAIGALAYVGAVATAGAVVASGGTLAGAIAAAAMAGGAGGLIGSVLARMMEDHHAHELQAHINHGGLLLWVRTRDKAHEQRAVEILKRLSGRDVHLHRLSPQA